MASRSNAPRERMRVERFGLFKHFQFYQRKEKRTLRSPLEDELFCPPEHTVEWTLNDHDGEVLGVCLSTPPRHNAILLASICAASSHETIFTDEDQPPDFFHPVDTVPGEPPSVVIFVEGPSGGKDFELGECPFEADPTNILEIPRWLPYTSPMNAATAPSGRELTTQVIKATRRSIRRQRHLTNPSPSPFASEHVK
ncbi:hypothetical protein BC834DRAFT_519349 [Gloeopeniophorella convolvens]|nr:hypothetical protein BC834DRAFT_519349 [Gloeopeniophorella convolvens]